MTIEEIEIINNIYNRVRFIPGSWDKRFIRDLYSGTGKELTPPQSEWLYRILYKYRKQLPRTYERYKHHPHCSRKPEKARFFKTQPAAVKPRTIKSTQLKIEFK